MDEKDLAGSWLAARCAPRGRSWALMQMALRISPAQPVSRAEGWNC